MPRRTAPKLPLLTVGVDTGGTFTDLVYVRRGRLHAHKVPSTPGAPANAVLRGVAEIRRPDEDVALVLATTVATNALLTGTGARIGLVTTRGFEDVLEIGRQVRPRIYALDVERPAALVATVDRLGVSERLGHDGSVLTALDLADVRAVGRRLARRGIASVAVCFLHSYADDRHERAAARELRRLGLDVSLSSRLCPLPREYERFVIAAANARVSPVVMRHLAPLRPRRKRPVASLRLMACDGGTMSEKRARAESVRTILSGPAGGMRAASAWWRRSRALLAGTEGLATLDVGGTSADCGFAADDVALTSEATIGQLPFTLPCLEVTSVGAGGGSIARLDRGGALVVGPESAGADPGPACYGKSWLPTVTDAFVVLGWVAPDSLLGGRIRIAPERSRAALARLAKSARMKVGALAEGIVRLATAEIARGLRRVTLARGKDTHRLALFGFGGAGGLFLAGLMDELAFPVGVVPPAPGALSALGALLAPPSRDAASPISAPLAAWPDARRGRRLLAMERRVRAELTGEGVAPAQVRVRHTVELGYEGQSYFLELPHDRSPATLSRAFHLAHRRRYGIAHPDSALWLQTLRVRATGPPALGRLPPPADAAGGAPPSRRGVLRRAELGAGFTARGPVTIVEETATTFVPRGFSLAVASDGSLLVRSRGPR